MEAITRPAPSPLVTSESAAPPDPPSAIRVERLSYRVGRTTILDGIDLAIPAGRLVAIAGSSGAGKTTLVEVLAGLRRPSSGAVRTSPAGASSTRTSDVPVDEPRIGFVPQEDIIHPHLPLRRTLVHAARLRVPASARDRVDATVDAVLAELGLADRADVPVGSLSGGQRKRASIAVELLAAPEILVLDEPTSGLDPARADEVVTSLIGLASRGVTVVMTTHHPEEIARCDHVVFLAPGGRVAGSGAPDEVRRRFGVDDLAAVYRLTATMARPVADRSIVDRPIDAPSPHAQVTGRRGTMGASAPRQWAVLTARTFEVIVRNRLTLAILVGSPALVITMMAILFPAGRFDGGDPTGAGRSQTAFWMAFCAFFFGLTYGLLQIVTERAVLRRERHAGLRLGAYLGSKLAVLLPVLALVVVALVAALALVDRLPSPAVVSYPELVTTLVLTALAGLLIGLAASAAVADATQATLALPMICFPQVLFGGAIVAVAQMTVVGKVISAGMATRWSYESLGEVLAPVGSGTGSPAGGWIGLTAICVVAAVGAVLVLHRRTSAGRR